MLQYPAVARCDSYHEMIHQLIHQHQPSTDMILTIHWFSHLSWSNCSADHLLSANLGHFSHWQCNLCHNHVGPMLRPGWSQLSQSLNCWSNLPDTRHAKLLYSLKFFTFCLQHNSRVFSVCHQWDLAQLLTLFVLKVQEALCFIPITLLALSASHNLE